MRGESISTRSADSGEAWTRRCETFGRVYPRSRAPTDIPFPFQSGVEPVNQQAPKNPPTDSLEKQIAAWRAHLQKSRAISASDVRELEDHLREQIASLS